MEVVPTSRDINKINLGGDTILTYAIELGANERRVTYLIRNGADVNASDVFGNTPLYITRSQKRELSIVRRLILSGADRCKHCTLKHTC